KYGYDVRPFDPQTFAPQPDGRYFASFLDSEKTQEQLKKFSRRDAERWDDYWAMWERLVERVRPLMLKPAPTMDELEAAFDGPQGLDDLRTLLMKSVAEVLD